MKVNWLIYCTTEMYDSDMSILPNVGEKVELYSTTYTVRERIFDGICDEVKIIIEEDE